MDGPDGKIAHAEVKIGDSMIMLGEENLAMGVRSPQSLGGTAVGIFIYVNDVDKAYSQAVSAGAKADMQPTNMFWGDRYGKLTDPYGHQWSMATHVEDVAPSEMSKRMKEFMANMGKTSKAGS
jgi:PhnB protein